MGDIGLFLPIALGIGLALWAYRHAKHAGRPDAIRRDLARILARDAFPRENPAALLPLSDLLMRYATARFSETKDLTKAAHVIIGSLAESWGGNVPPALNALCALIEAGKAPDDVAEAVALIKAIRRSYDPADTMDAGHALRRFDLAASALLHHATGAWEPKGVGRTLSLAVRACRGDFDALADALACLEMMQGEGIHPDEAARRLADVGPGRFEEALDACVKSAAPVPDAKPAAAASAVAAPAPAGADAPENEPGITYLDGKRLHEHLPLPEGMQEGPLACAIRVVLMRGFLRLTEDGAYDGGRRISQASLWRQARSEIERGGGDKRTFDQAMRWLKAEGVIADDRQGWHAQSLSRATVAGAALLRAAQALKRRPPTDPRVNVPTRDARA